MEHYLGVIKKYTVFSGRASRSEYWMFVLFNFLISIGLSFVSGLLVLFLGEDLSWLSSMVSVVYSLFIFLPSLAVGVRRLHDINKSGWWLLLALIPLLGGLILLVFSVMDSTPGDNQYGPNPKGVSIMPPTSPVTSVPTSTPPADTTATPPVENPTPQQPV